MEYEKLSREDLIRLVGEKDIEIEELEQELSSTKEEVEDLQGIVKDGEEVGHP